MKYLLLLLVSSNAFAVCHPERVCNSYGNGCHVVQLCDGGYDTPNPFAPQPSAFQPYISPTTPQPAPEAGFGPFGTHHCEYVPVNGQWVNVCR